MPVIAVPASKINLRPPAIFFKLSSFVSNNSIKENVFHAVYIGLFLVTGEPGGLLVAFTLIGKKSFAINERPVTATIKRRTISFTVFCRIKNKAGIVPRAAAHTTEPDPPNKGITRTISTQPKAAPARSKAYSRLILNGILVKRRDIANPEIKNGAATTK